MPMPAAKPMAVASTPTASASAATVSTTWRRDAPTARISADSRVRWATRIENVLWMLKAATTMAMPAKASSSVWKKPRKSLSTSRCCSAVSSAPVSASTPSGSVAAIRDSSCVGADAVGGAHEHAGDRVGAAGEQLLGGVGVEGDVRDAADLLGRAVGRQTDDVDGDRLGREHGRLVADATGRRARRWPGRRRPRRLACGARPSVSVSQLSSGSAIQLAAMVGGPSPPTGWPSAPISWAVPRTSGTAEATPSTAATSATSTRRSGRASGSPRCRCGWRCGRRRRFRRWPR